LNLNLKKQFQTKLELSEKSKRETGFPGSEPASSLLPAVLNPL
jgi:hypothetical protein